MENGLNVIDKTILGLTAGLLITMGIFYESPETRNTLVCKYSYLVRDVDYYSQGYTNEIPSTVNGCVQTTTNVYCGTMSLERTKKGTTYCEKKGK